MNPSLRMDRTVVYVSSDLTDASFVRALLESHDIPCSLVDDRSLIYPQLGEVKVLVDRDHVLRALYIVREQRNP